jgi:hypothetical protein
VSSASQSYRERASLGRRCVDEEVLRGARGICQVQEGAVPAPVGGPDADRLVAVRGFKWEAGVVAVAHVGTGLGQAARGHFG